MLKVNYSFINLLNYLEILFQQSFKFNWNTLHTLWNYVHWYYLRNLKEHILYCNITLYYLVNYNYSNDYYLYVETFFTSKLVKQTSENKWRMAISSRQNKFENWKERKTENLQSYTPSLDSQSIKGIGKITNGYR